MIKPVLIFLAKALLKFAVDKALEKQLPRIFERIDASIPTALFNGASPVTVKSEIEYVVGQVTAKPATKEIVDLVAALYDPIKNAERTQRYPR